MDVHPSQVPKGTIGLFKENPSEVTFCMHHSLPLFMLFCSHLFTNARKYLMTSGGNHVGASARVFQGL